MTHNHPHCKECRPDVAAKISIGASNRPAWTHTEEAKRKIGDAFRGQTLSAEHRARIGAANKGKHTYNGPPRKGAQVLAAKRRPCTDCGQSFPPEVLEFDHVPERGEKLFSLSTADRTGRWSLTDIAAEIRKCDVVCPTCHRLRTYYRRQGM